MEEQKVYLFVETPFSLKKPKGFLLLPMMFSLVVYAVMIAVFWLKMPENAVPVTVALAGASVLSMLMIAVFRLSYVTLEDNCMVCRYGGIIPKKVHLSSRLSWKVIGGQLRVFAGSALLLQMPDSDAARRLMTAARIPAAR